MKDVPASFTVEDELYYVNAEGAPEGTEPHRSPRRNQQQRQIPKAAPQRLDHQTPESTRRRHRPRSRRMPVATPAQYRAMLDAAQKGGYAYPAINVTSLPTINGALKAFAESQSPTASSRSPPAVVSSPPAPPSKTWPSVPSSRRGRHILAERYDILVALHTDHCHPKNVEKFLKPLIAATAARRAAGKGNLFNSHMFDGSELPLEENIKQSK
jgi:hypothetical protein